MANKFIKSKIENQADIGAGVYCSLDIETSGFDPLVNEVLEVGFAMFEVMNGKVIIKEKWTQVFKPSKPVVPQILGLTGITQQELDEAPLFEDFKAVLQDKLGNVNIVGHNILFDTKFLEAFGITFKGKLLDTLDLVQWLLPTHHSYNLENLMHTFGIAHKDAHRALADAIATISLVEKLLIVYKNLDPKLVQEILTLIEKSDFTWANLLNTELSEQKKVAKLKITNLNVKAAEDFGSLELVKNSVYNFKIGSSYAEILQSIKNLYSVKTLVVVPKIQNALNLFKSGIVNSILVSQEYKFDPTAFKKFKNKKNLTVEELKFVLKVLVWEATNWQTETILDLNLSFFGGQFKEMITASDVEVNTKARVLVCDQPTFLKLANTKELQNRKVVIFGLSEFENSITSNIGVKASWGYIAYIVKSFYNIELNTGNSKFKEPVENALLVTDLFFGLINALLQTNPPSFQYYKITQEVEQSENYVKIHAAAESYVSKLIEINKDIKSESIAGFIDSITNFFLKEDNKVKWIELAEGRCTLMSMPIQIDELVKSVLIHFKEVVFIDTLGSEVLNNFFVSRLGLSAFSQNIIQSIESKKAKTQQRDLFSDIKQVFIGTNTVNFHFIPANATAKDYLEIIEAEKTIQMALLFPNPSQLKEFYEQNYINLKKKTAVLAQSHSGGSNKILRNFSINTNSLLLATDKFILKALTANSQVEQVENLSVSTLIISRLPFEQFSHPYQEAVSNSVANSFTDYALPRALFNIYTLIKFFYTPKLKDIYIFDAKLSKDYAKVFLDIYNYIPNAKKD